MASALAAAVLVAAVVAGAVGPVKPAQATHLGPSPGDFNLLDVLNKLSGQNIQQAMAMYPVPFAILTRSTSKGGARCPAAGTVVENIETFRAGSPKRIDIDSCGATGVGGSDIEVLVEQLLPTATDPFRLRLTINRLTPPAGLSATAADVTAVIAFPMQAFNSESLAAPPYLFWGYSTRENAPGQTRFIPGSEVLVFTPNVFGGTIHSLGMQLTSTDTPDSLRFHAGLYQNQLALNPPPPGATIIDLLDAGLRMTPVPATASLTLNTSEIFSPTPNLSQFTLNWAASAPTKLELDYEDQVGPSTGPTKVYTNTIVIDQMPTSEALSVTLNLGASPPSFTVNHTGNSTINQVTIARTQTDGNAKQSVTLNSVPREMTLTLLNNKLTGTFGPVDAAANSPVLGAAIVDLYDSGGILGSNFKRAQGKMERVPDFALNWNTSTAVPNVSLSATNPGDFIGFAGVAMATQNTPPPGNPFPALWDPNPSSHPGPDDRDHVLVFEDGVDGPRSGFRFAAGLAQVKNVTFNLNTDNPNSAFNMDLAGPNHAKLRLFIDKATAVQLPNDQDISINCDIHDVPRQINLTGTNFADQWNYTASDPIAEITCSGKIGTKEFQLTINNLPTSLTIDSDGGASHFNVTVPAGQQIGLFQLLCYDPFGIDGTTGVFGVELRHVKIRVAQVPTMTSNWAYSAAGFVFNVNTPSVGVLGSAEIAGAVQDLGSLAASNLPPPASVGASDHYARILDQGTSGPQKQFGFRVVDIDSVSSSYTPGPAGAAGNVTFNYATTVPHALRGFWDTHETSTLTGPNKRISNARLNVLNLPATINFSSNLSTQLNYNASGGINEINFTADVGLKQPDNSVPITHIDGLATGLPATVTYQLVPAVEGSASITMSNPITRVMVELTGDNGILNGEYKHILLDVQNIPANWNASWGIAGGPHASLSTSSPLGPVSVIVSRDVKANTPSKYNPFTANGGAVQYTGFTREIDRRYFRQGAGDDNVRETVFMSRLDSLYNTTTKLDNGEDHVIYRKNAGGQLDFLSVRGSGFQCLTVRVGAGAQCPGHAPGAAGEITATLNVPVPGVHPFYVGIEDTVGKFLTVQVADIPDTTRVLVGPSRAHIDFSGSPGDIVIYNGPLPSANDSQDATKVIVTNTPSFAHLDWNLGFPGGVTFDVSSPAPEIKILTQNGSTRTVVDFIVGDLSANWGFESGTTTEKCQLDPPGCGEYLNIAKVFFNFVANPAIDGFVMSYDRIGGLVDLDPGCLPGCAHGANEYVPRISVLVDDFSHFGASVQLEVCLIGVCPIGVILPNIDIDTDLLGSFNFDWWDLGGGFLDFFGDPDYKTNDPWDFWPLFHSQDDHLFPFSP